MKGTLPLSWKAFVAKSYAPDATENLTDLEMVRTTATAQVGLVLSGFRPGEELLEKLRVLRTDSHCQVSVASGTRSEIWHNRKAFQDKGNVPSCSMVSSAQVAAPVGAYLGQELVHRVGRTLN